MGNKILNRRKFLQGSLASCGTLLGSSLISPMAYSAKVKHRLIFGHTFGPATNQYMITGLSLFKSLAEKYSDGELLVDIHDAGSLGGQNVLPQKVLTGSIQGCQVSTLNFVHYSEVYSILDFPYLFNSNNDFENTIQTNEFSNSEFFSKPARSGFQIVPGMWANAGFRVLGISRKVDRTVRLPKDLEGLKVRTNGTKVEDVMFKMTSANPVSIAWAEAYQAMQQGTADALSVGLGPLTATKIHETLGSATLYEQSFNCHITALNKRWYDKRPKKIQEAIMRAGRESYAFQRQGQAQANKAMVDLWKNAGIEVVVLTPEEKKIWVDTIGHQRPEYNNLKDKFGRKSFELIKSLQG